MLWEASKYLKWVEYLSLSWLKIVDGCILWHVLHHVSKQKLYSSRSKCRLANPIFKEKVCKQPWKKVTSSLTKYANGLNRTYITPTPHFLRFSIVISKVNSIQLFVSPLAPKNPTQYPFNTFKFKIIPNFTRKYSRNLVWSEGWVFCKDLKTPHKSLKEEFKVVKGTYFEDFPALKLDRYVWP